MLMLNLAQIGSNTMGIRSVFAAGLLAMATSSAIAQPSYSQLPVTFIDETSSDGTRGVRISPNGLIVVGMRSEPFNFFSDAFAYYADSGLLRLRAIGFSDFLPSVVTDSGHVFGSGRPAFFDETYTRWHPISGEFVQAGRPEFFVMNIRDVSADGLVIVGETGVPRKAFRLDMGPSGPSPSDRLTFLGEPQNGVARVVIRRGLGLYDVWGISSSPPTLGQAATRWSLNTSGPGERFPIDNVFDVSEDGTKLLHPNFIWTASGITPFQLLPPFDDIKPTSMSADGRVVTGFATFSVDPQFGPSSVVVFRDGGAPEDVRLLLNSAGVSTPGWTAGGRNPMISDDGTTIAATYFSNDRDILGNRIVRGFVATIPPKNDGCVNARPVTFGVYTDSTRGALPSVFSGTCFPDTTSGDIWYIFSPVTNETVRLDTCGSDFDTTLTVYAGSPSNCGTGSGPIACNNDSFLCAANNGASRLDFGASLGVTYYIRVAGLNNARGNATLSISAPNRPVNDSCAGAVNLDAGFSRLFDTTGATTDARPGCAGSPLPFFDLWYRTVAPDTGRMTFSTCGSQGNFVVAVYAADACGNPIAQPIDCSGTVGCTGLGGVITVPCTRDQVLYVRVGGAFGAQGGGGRINALFACDAPNTQAPYPASIAFAPLAQRALAYYRFEDAGITRTADSIRTDPFSCGNYPGLPVDVARVPGVLGSAMVPNFFSIGSGIRNIFAPANLGDATLEAWVNTEAPSGGYILDSREDASQLGLTLTYGVYGENHVAFLTEGPNNFNFGARATVPLADGRWHHIVGTRRNILAGFGTLFSYTLYVDGEIVAGSNTIDNRSAVNVNATGPWTIGNRTSNPDFFSTFLGALDEVAIYPSIQAGTSIIDRYLLATGGCSPPILNRANLLFFSTGAPAGGTLSISLEVRTSIPVTYRWDVRSPGGATETLTDGQRPDGSIVSGASTANLSVANVTVAHWNRTSIIGRVITSCGERTITLPVSVTGNCRCSADFNCDGELDPDDLADFIGCYFATPPCPAAELNGDGTVDPDDLADFIGSYFSGCP